MIFTKYTSLAFVTYSLVGTYTKNTLVIDRGKCVQKVPTCLIFHVAVSGTYFSYQQVPGAHCTKIILHTVGEH